ncbi:hypothetical protein [Natronococcus sp. A-GB7]|uniref:hypothetical protein n=1 Tax=Natronococcus sp. A-GB7 TaxID=3037649 RepID=UPI00241F9C7D|nr:hypothetical protein [Natronococcus sp. A-GB7]MDG5819545.1 hypothetical protein [Natronococcus sp. A-GB7]
MTVGIVFTPEGRRRSRVHDPRNAVIDAGTTVEVLGTETGEAETVSNDLEPGRRLRDRTGVRGETSTTR